MVDMKRFAYRYVLVLCKSVTYFLTGSAPLREIDALTPIASLRKALHEEL